MTLRVGVPGHEDRIRELARVEMEEGAGRSQGQPYGDLEAIGGGVAPERVTSTSR
ncbi:hypothetical protein [Zhihengliuella sp.]|uniref:hypothetical protein n=1 Tax=Zhihengliuella sp. TaxID=1954483 RepID=UPI002811F873|nr:hypothetical protein [Zhihengliuella sp.]